jgi:hypothetical protein
MKRAQLKELLRKALYEGPTKQANKEKKSAYLATVGDKLASMPGGKGSPSISPGKSITYSGSGRGQGSAGKQKVQVDFTKQDRAKQDARGKQFVPVDPYATPGQGAAIAAAQSKQSSQTDTPVSATNRLAQARSAAGNSKPSGMFGGSPKPNVAAQPGGQTTQNMSSVAPTNVQAAVQQGGKVAFGRYYDASGKYLGRSQGGKWVDAASDPNAKTQMEMYQKMMEIESGRYSSKDKEMVKEMIREVMKSCK